MILIVEEVKRLFEKMDSNGTWTIKLIRIHSSNREGTNYNCREIGFSSKEVLVDHIEALKNKYLMGSKATLQKYNELRLYDGTTDSQVIYWLNKTSELIADTYSKLIESMANADQESDPLKEKYSAYVLNGFVDEKPIYLFSMQCPFVNMQRKHIWDKSTFRPIDKPILSLRLNADVIMYDEKVYFLSMAGENLFNMERAYKATCSYCVNDIVASGIITDIECFKNTAMSGSNPRRFVSYNSSHLERLKNKKTRERIAKKFDIPVKDSFFDSEQDGASEKIVKLLCGTGMVDPFDDIPMEVAGSKNWS